MLLLITEVPIPLSRPNATLRCTHEAQLREMEAEWSIQQHNLTQRYQGNS